MLQKQVISITELGTTNSCKSNKKGKTMVSQDYVYDDSLGFVTQKKNDLITSYLEFY